MGLMQRAARALGFEVMRTEKANRLQQAARDNYGWIDDPRFPNSFQTDTRVDPHTAQTNWVVWACQTLIAGDMGKMRCRIQRQTRGIWEEVESPSFSPFFRKPNHFQTWQQFEQHRVLSKLSNGNSYVLKERDGRGVVVSGYVLDPWCVEPLVDQVTGAVFYRFRSDALAGIEEEGQVVVPADEIFHDRDWCLYHPLIGLSPLYACGAAAMQGMDIQSYSRTFFRNGARPSGILVSPQFISPALAQQYKSDWETKYAGDNRGRTAVLGNGLKYEVISENAVDSQLTEQLKLTAEMVCSAYHVPGYKVGVGATPTYQNADVLEQIYYKNCLQVLIEDAESVWNDGLGLTAAGYRAEYDLTDLLRMDSAAQIEYASKGVEKGLFSINEGRRLFNQPPVKGGEEPLSQQQYFPISMLRDFHEQEMASKKAAEVKPLPAPSEADPNTEVDAAKQVMDRVTRGVLELARA